MQTIEVSNPLWHIAGIGAMGSLVAGKFYHTKATIKLLLKSEEQLTTYQESLLTVINDNNSLSCHPQATVIDQLGDEPIHYLLCCVKAYEITKLLQRLKRNLNTNSIIILIHNGMGVLDEIKTLLPELRIITGISTVGGYLEKPFTVRAFLNGKFHLGAAIGRFSRNEIKTVCTAFQTAILPYQWDENIDNMAWEKFSLNCSINILTASLNCKNGDLLCHVELLKKMTEEVAEVLSAYDVTVSANSLFLKVTQLLHRVANNYSSMYNDVRNNRPTELRYLNDYLIKLAQQKNIPTPLNTQLLNQFSASSQ